MKKNPTRPAMSGHPQGQGRPRTALRAVLLATALLSAGLVTPALAANKARLSTYDHGKPVDYLPCGAYALPTRAAVLMGGGLDVKEAFRWMIERMADCGSGLTGRPGNLLVIRAGGNPAYDSFIYKLGKLAAVQTVVVPTVDAANSTELEGYIRKAGAIWFTGGDQGDYYNFWKGTLLERVLSDHVRTYGIPVGGTSAGMMILSQYAYIAYPSTITSAEALADPFKPDAVTIKRDFWTYGTPFEPLSGTVTDSHFDARDRMGRLLTFLARVIGDGWSSAATARAIGVDQETALLMSTTPGSAGAPSVTLRTVANPGVDGAAYLLRAASNSSLVLAPGLPLTFTRVQVRKLPAISAPSTYELNVDGGQLSSSTGSTY